MNASITWTAEDGIAVVTLDAQDERVNILNAHFLEHMAEVAEELAGAEGIQAAVVLSAKPAGFIAGADISVIEGVTNTDEGARLARQGQQVFQLWDELPFPVVAAIHGHCMGGGFEFVLSCSYRIAAEDAVIALPEVKLGILPGFGGTQRLPRLIGLQRALDLILSGRTVRGSKTLDTGIVDRLAKPEDLRESAITMARELVEDPGPVHARRAQRLGGLRYLLLERNPIGRAILFNKARDTLLAKTGGHYPAPLRALEIVKETCTLTLDEGLALEARALGEMIITPESKNLVHIYHLSQRPKKGSGLEVTPQPVEKAAVLGAGVMGASIAWTLASSGVSVILKDIDQAAVDRGIQHCRELFAKKLRTQSDDPKVSDKMAMLAGTTEYAGFDTVDLVIEAVLERMDVKQAVLVEVERHLRDDAIFATNTSALSVSTLQSSSTHPTRVAGMHFFNPVEKMPLVEVIRGDQTTDIAVETVFALARNLGKTPIVTADRPGFLVNRLLVTYLNEAMLMVEEGVDWLGLEKLATDFGLPMGPFRLVDEVGIDIALEVGSTLTEAFEYLPKATLLNGILDAGLLGKKNGQGFYQHPKGNRPTPNTGVEEFLSDTRRPVTENDWQRLMMVMVAEAYRCLDEKVVENAADIDTGMVFGTGFPPFRGGLCRWADTLERHKLSETLAQLAQDHGPRFVLPGNPKTPADFYD